MTRPQIKVEGGRELASALKAVSGGTDDLKAANLAGAELVKDEAKRIVPKLTGRLDGSIKASGQAKTGVVRAGGAAVPWAGPVHFGWPAGGMAPQPFLYDALDARHDDVVTAYRQGVEDLIKKHQL